MDTVFPQLGEIVGGNQVLFPAAKPVFVSCGFDVRSVRVYVQWATVLVKPRGIPWCGGISYGLDLIEFVN
jgi:peptidoglycan/LPS O-acetylase OafA/YrhL